MGAHPPPPEMTYGFLIQLVFYKKKTMWFIGVEVEQETSAPPPEKNPGSAPAYRNPNFEISINYQVNKQNITVLNIKKNVFTHVASINTILPEQQQKSAYTRKYGLTPTGLV